MPVTYPPSPHIRPPSVATLCPKNLRLTPVSLNIYQKNDDGSKAWQTSNLSTEELCELPIPSELCIIYVPSDPFMKVPELCQILSAKFSIPSCFWTGKADEATGFYGCEDESEPTGDAGYCSFFRFLIKHQFRNAYKHSFSYNWYKIGCFTRWLPGKQNVILCFDIGYELQFRILESLHNSIGASFGDPYIVHTTIVQEVGILFDTSVWDLRHLVREIEKTRATVLPEEIDFPRFHELSRHVLHSSETLTVASETLKSMVEEHESFIQSRLRQNVAVDRTSKKIQGTLKYQTSLFRCFKERSIALEKRLQNEIDLAYNLVAQSDSRTSVGIGAAAQRDSAAMKTIAVMTLTFLPGTFIASLFSMSFFDRTTNTQTQQAHIYATEDFWKYWAVTVPLTVVIVALWFLWHHDYAKRYAASKK